MPGTVNHVSWFMICSWIKQIIWYYKLYNVQFNVFNMQTATQYSNVSYHVMEGFSLLFGLLHERQRSCGRRISILMVECVNLQGPRRALREARSEDPSLARGVSRRWNPILKTDAANWACLANQEARKTVKQNLWLKFCDTRCFAWDCGWESSSAQKTSEKFDCKQ